MYMLQLTLFLLCLSLTVRAGPPFRPTRHAELMDDNRQNSIPSELKVSLLR